MHIEVSTEYSRYVVNGCGPASTNWISWKPAGIPAGQSSSGGLVYRAFIFDMVTNIHSQYFFTILELSQPQHAMAGMRSTI